MKAKFELKVTPRLWGEVKQTIERETDVRSGKRPNLHVLRHRWNLGDTTIYRINHSTTWQNYRHMSMNKNRNYRNKMVICSKATAKAISECVKEKEKMARSAVRATLFSTIFILVAAIIAICWIIQAGI